jgi:hypothetical protein
MYIKTIGVNMVLIDAILCALGDGESTGDAEESKENKILELRFEKF